MHPTILPVANMLDRNAMLFAKAVGDIKDEDQLRRPAPTANSINWIAGHVTLYRYMILKVMGENVTTPWEDLYSRGLTVQDDLKYPSLSEIQAMFTPTIEQIKSVMESMSEDQWAAKPIRELEGFESSVRGTTAFLVRHETYHIGQLSYVRRLFGYDQLVG